MGRTSEFVSNEPPDQRFYLAAGETGHSRVPPTAIRSTAAVALPCSFGVHQLATSLSLSDIAIDRQYVSAEHYRNTGQAVNRDRHLSLVIEAVVRGDTIRAIAGVERPESTAGVRMDDGLVIMRKLGEGFDSHAHSINHDQVDQKAGQVAGGGIESSVPCDRITGLPWRFVFVMKCHGHSCRAIPNAWDRPERNHMLEGCLHREIGLGKGLALLGRGTATPPQTEEA